MKLLRVFSLLVVLCFTQKAVAQDATSFNNNTITIKNIIDTLVVIDPETSKEEVIFRKQQLPSLINGEQIYYEKEANEPAGAARQSTLADYLRTNLLLQELDNARGEVNNLDIVIDKDGKPGYVRIFFNKPDNKQNAAILEAIEKKLKSKTFVPAQKNGKSVAYGVKISGL